VQVPGMPQLVEAVSGAIAPAELAEVGQRPVAPQIDVESQQAALAKGAALTPVCESASGSSGELA
ncbi:hypothetical protein ACTXGQ_25240, partial [Marinobacter sp. 1Y8]